MEMPQTLTPLAVSAIIIGGVVRLLKSDTKLPIDIPARWRALVAFVLGLVAGVINLVLDGNPVNAAIIAVVSPALASFGHGIAIEGLRNGREVAVPGLMKKPSPIPTKTSGIAIVFALLAFGCGGNFEEARAPHLAVGAAPPSDRCVTLDDRTAFYGGASKFTGALSGAAGLSTVIVPDDMNGAKGTRVGLAIGSVVMASAAVGAAFVSDSAATSWARECSR